MHAARLSAVLDCLEHLISYVAFSGEQRSTLFKLFYFSFFGYLESPLCGHE